LCFCFLLVFTTIGILIVPAGAYVLTTDPNHARSIRAWWNGGVYQGEEGVIRQQTKYDCGVVSLQMALRDRGITAQLGDLRLSAKTSYEGASLLGLKRAVDRYGVKASAWSLNQKDLLRVELPIIAFVDGNHFVVISNVNKDGTLIILDPARGRLQYSRPSFGRHWNGEALILGEYSNRVLSGTN
jgi:ABC-type bacteriocin/lantibiotic exporter with double-glycine peptidase domain